MPIYEFYSPRTHKIYSFFARSLAYAGKVPRCPDGAEFPMEKLLSSFSVTGRAKEKPESLDGTAMDDPRLEQAMAEMEREMGGMDEGNPDPRQMARMMKRMAELTGEKMPGPLQEMMARMEKGEDPEKLEAEYGDALGEADAGSGEGEAGGKAWRRLRQARIQRDPTLYEMAEYVD